MYERPEAGLSAGVRHGGHRSDISFVRRKKKTIRKIKEGTRLAMMCLRATNRRASRIIPYGYRLDEDGATLVVHDAEYRLAQEILELRWSGKTYRRIAEDLNERGKKPRTAERWHASTVRAVVVRFNNLRQERRMLQAS